MPISRVDYGGQTLIDITDSTVSEAMVLSGYIFYDAAGNRRVGTLEAYSVVYDLTDVDSSSSIQVIPFGGSFTTVLSTDSSHIVSEVLITMGGADVTENVYDSETREIDIPVVSGPIVIHAIQADKPVSVFTPSWLVFTANSVGVRPKWSIAVADVETAVEEYPTVMSFVAKVNSNYWATNNSYAFRVRPSDSYAYTYSHIAKTTKTLNVGGQLYAVIETTREAFLNAYASYLSNIESGFIAMGAYGEGGNVPSRYTSKNFLADGVVTADNVVRLCEEAGV